MSDSVSIDICVCTFRRPHIDRTLRSLAALTVKPEWTIRIIVADNDDTASAEASVASAARETGLSLAYIHAPARNISIARNACLDAAAADLIAFIDDDELATADWLCHLIAAMQHTQSEVVLGPVQALYDDACPLWLREGDFHSTRPVWVGGTIVTGYTCNVLFKRLAPAVAGQRFRIESGRSGGEDTVFFSAIAQAGGRIAYAPQAIVTEAVTAGRATLAWLLKRKFRSGQTHGFLLVSASRNVCGRIKAALEAIAKVFFCLCMAGLTLASAVRVRFWLLRGALHAGVLSGLLGRQAIEQYGGPHAN